jgi:3-hydroxyacyl-[acyl-carrier-protein] dehydratase
MHFNLVDAIIEQTADRIVTVKNVSSAEEYLADHFPTFPVLPGVLMLESMVHAARLLAGACAGAPEPLVLGRVRALKYGAFMPPGATLRVEVTLLSRTEDGQFEFKGEGKRLSPGRGEEAGPPPTAVSGRFTLRPVRLGVQG